MNYCDSCGRKVLPEYQYCPFCGGILKGYIAHSRKGNVRMPLFSLLLGLGIAIGIFYFYHFHNSASPGEEAEGELSRQKGIVEGNRIPEDREENDSGTKGGGGTLTTPGGKSGSKISPYPESKETVPRKDGAYMERAESPGENALPVDKVKNEFSVHLSQQQINDLLRHYLQTDKKNVPLDLDMLHTAHISIKNNKIILSGIVNLEEIATRAGSPESQATIDKMKKFLPFIDMQKLPLEIAGDLNVKNGNLIIDRDAEVKVAGLRLQLKTLHGLLLPGEPMPDQVPLQTFDGISIDNLYVQNDGLFISGRRMP